MFQDSPPDRLDLTMVPLFYIVGAWLKNGRKLATKGDTESCYNGKALTSYLYCYYRNVRFQPQTDMLKKITGLIVTYSK